TRTGAASPVFDATLSALRSARSFLRRSRFDTTVGRLADERTPAAASAQLTQYGGFRGPWLNTRQSVQNSPPQVRQVRSAGSNGCLSQRPSIVLVLHSVGARSGVEAVRSPDSSVKDRPVD